MMTPLARSIPFRLAVSLALTVAMAWLSLVPGYPDEDDPALVVAVGTVPALVQNTMHLVLYAALTLLWAATLVRSVTRPAHWAAVLVFLYGGALEVAQILVPGRYPSLLDIVLNGTGVVLGAALATALIARVRPA